MSFVISGRRIVLTGIFSNETIKKVLVLKSEKKGKIRIAMLDDKGGFGDVLLDAFFASKLKEKFGENISIDYYSKYSGIFAEDGIFDALYPVEKKAECDLIFRSKHFMYILGWNPEKIEKVSQELFEICRRIIAFQEDNLGNRMDISAVYNFAKFFGKKRMEASDLLGLTGVSRRDTIAVTFHSDPEEVLKKFDLQDKPFITFNRDIDSKESLDHPKVWPLDSYNSLGYLIKKGFPDIDLVQIGASNRFGQLECVDHDLTGKTDFEELKVLLSRATLNISSEGGLVHLMHILGGRSAVIFGPTDEEYFGYDEDLIFTNRKCLRPCNYLKPGWLKKCILGDTAPSCMKDVSPEQVFSGIKLYILEKQVESELV